MILRVIHIRDDLVETFSCTVFVKIGWCTGIDVVRSVKPEFAVPEPGLTTRVDDDELATTCDALDPRIARRNYRVQDLQSPTIDAYARIRAPQSRQQFLWQILVKAGTP